MGFKLPGRSIISGTSAHSSALKMKAEANAAAKMKREAAAKMKMEAAAKMGHKSATKLKKDSPVDKTLVGKQHNLPEELKAKIEAAPGKMKPSPVKESFSQAYRSNRDAGKKYFTYKGKEYTTESRSEKAEREKTGKTYAELNPRTTKKDDALTKEIKDVSDVKKVQGPREGTKKEKVQVAKKNVKDVKKEAKTNVKDVKKEGKIKTLKAKQKVAETKGRSRRAERLERKIERKETGKTIRQQRQERRTAKKANEKARSSEVANEAVKNANKAIEKQKGNSPITMKPGKPRSKTDKKQFTKSTEKATKKTSKPSPIEDTPKERAKTKKTFKKAFGLTKKK